MKHTSWHEVGHINAIINYNSEKEEIEAHFFAAQANAPNILIKTIANRGYRITVSFLMECFGLSDEAARKKIDYLSKYNFDHANEFDDVVLLQFSDYINAKYPPRTKHFYDDYYEDLEKERGNWY